MKKATALTLSLFLAFGLAACGNTAGNNTPNDASSTVESLPETAGDTSGIDTGVGEEAAKNGTYSAQMDDDAAEASHGYRDQLTVTYTDGKITEAQFDSVRLSDGVLKSTLGEDEYPMTDADGNAYPPSVWMSALNENILAAAGSEDIDAVSGATSASKAARELLAAIEAEGVEGETITVASSAE